MTGGASPSAGGQAAPRIQYLEWARAFGALGIVLLHVFVVIARETPAPGIGSERLMVYRLVGMVLARWCVPVFLMVSGALLLDPAKRLGVRKLGRYVGRMLFVLCTFGLAFALMQEYVEQGGVSWGMIATSLRDVVFAQSWDHLWYIYAMVGLYALTPLFRAFTARATREEWLWVLGFLLGFCFVVPLLNHELGWGITTFFLDLPCYFAYYLLGYYAHTNLRFTARWALAGGACVLAMAALVVWGASQPGVDVGELYAPDSPLLCVYAVTVFLALRRFLDKEPIASHRFFASVARLSFGIYIIHPLFGHIALRLTDPLDYPPVLYEAALFVVGLVGSMALTWLLKKLPGFRKAL